MKILLIGSGGREHALAWKLAQSPLCETLYAAPGNPGISEIARCVDIRDTDIDALVDFAVKEKIDFVVPGPETPLVLGLADRLREQGIPIFGPDMRAAALEGSKGFMKDLCAKYGIPTAAYGRFTEEGSALDFAAKRDLPVVVKADGLAAGKGVRICQTHEEAFESIRDMLSGNAFGESGSSVVIEAFLEGEEVSYFAITDGETLLPLASAQDHKRAFDNDQGPNTGGMGAYSPARPEILTPELEEKILSRILRPTIRGMREEGCPFTGILYAGLMIANGEPSLLEYNVRFGDPECQPLMMRLESDLVEILFSAAKGTLKDLPAPKWNPDPALCVVMASKGYPGSCEKGSPIKGLETAKTPDVEIFHAGTSRNESGELVNSGGRVLGVTAKGKTVREAREKAYESVEKINWPSGFYRKDIGWRALLADPPCS